MKKDDIKKTIKSAGTFEELLDIKYGKIGTPDRDKFETKVQYFVISELLKAARREENITQEDLAHKIGTKKSFISRIENGNCNIQLSTLYRIFETGLGRRVNVSIG
ncbi:MAG: helix-turn-helix transcriptional regulator [Bacteroidetes bacterium]|nr:helix-turn-helix transcriptional regulator [Bacteroidota bacterium]